ncbi:MAG: DUF4184 family protein, partial [Leifsonia sp.]
WVVDHLAPLRVQLGPLPVEKWLQHASTIAGLTILTVWAVNRLLAGPADPGRWCRLGTRGRVAAWSVFVAAGLAGGLVPWIMGMLSGTPPFDPGLVFRVARFGIAAGGAVVVLVVCCWYLVPALRRSRPAS